MPQCYLKGCITVLICSVELRFQQILADCRWTVFKLPSSEPTHLHSDYNFTSKRTITANN